jgi:hypothetical protein
VFNAVADPNVGFPNGRRLQDDVVDVLERVVGGGILRGGVGLNLLLSDKVDANDRAFDTVFPYVPAPWSGSEVGIDTTNKLLHQFR